MDCSVEFPANLQPSGLDVVLSTETIDVEANDLCTDLGSFPPGPADNDFTILVRRPEDPLTEEWPDGPTPQGTRPWIVLQHGSTHDPAEYEHIVEPLVAQGFVVLLPDAPNSGGGEDRSDYVRCAVRWATSAYSDADRLGSCFGLIGHSTGGEGVILAARRMAENQDSELNALAGVVAIAPDDPADFDLTFAEQQVPTMVLVGSHDDDIGLGGHDAYEVAANEGSRDRASIQPGSQPGRTGEKVFIEGYDVAHNAFGGGAALPAQVVLPGNEMAAKGHALAAQYVPAFFFWQLFGDTSYRPRFTDNVVPQELDVDAWWNYFPQWSGEPLVFSSYQVGDRRGIGMRSLSIATLEGDELEPFDYSGVGGRSVDPELTRQHDVQVELYPGGLDATNRNRALRVDWQASIAGSVRWDFSPTVNLAQPFAPDHLSFRIHNVFEDWQTGHPSCTAPATEQPLTVDVRAHDTQDAVASARFEDIVVQDHMNAGADCDGTQSLYTVRIPLSCMSAESGPTLTPDLIDSIDLRFGADGSSGSVVVDSVELTYSQEELTSPSCDHLGVPPPPLAPGYLCVDYDPGSFVTFTPGSGGPNAPLGEVSFDGAFAQFVAGRPGVVTDCDSARYELDTISADRDGDGTTEALFDVRAIERVDGTDLVALLGFEEGDAAVTINEPGKPQSNAVELYDYGSFLAALRRFAALPSLEVRMLRDNGGVHQPVHVAAEVPAELSGVEPPAAPTLPSVYSLPSGATSVSSSADLVAELALPNGHDIILEDGDYDWTGPVTAAGPHRLWAENLGGATLSFGLTYAGNANRIGGLELHGLQFAVDDASMTPTGVGSTHILYTWGQGGEDVRIEDCRFDGDLVVGNGVGAFAPNGLAIRRSTFTNFWGNAVFAKQGSVGTVLASEPIFEDLTIESIYDSPPGSSNGARESGLLIGNNATVSRVDIRDVGWSGIQLYNDATGVAIEDVYVDYAGPGVWGSSYTDARGAAIWLSQAHDVDIARVRIEAHTFLGVNVVWDGGNPNPFANTTAPRNHDIRISDIYSRAYKIGIHLDLGVEAVVIDDARFEHAWMAGVLDNNRFEDDWGWYPCTSGAQVCLESTNRIETIDCYLKDEADCVAHHHHGGGASPPPTGWPSHPDSYIQPGGDWSRAGAAYPIPGGGGGPTGTGGGSDSTG